ncbi:immunity 42 family protein [Brenneria uluponensis]|uniref:immunity 42 family protein n=1 Tax=Brenneria uluponensis TaxID=3057057 RepID=UPI0028E270D0|nr:immunity 42 family protein [Brenneria ulupoensis]
MIFGDPNEFAILMDVVPAWTSGDSYKNGLFHFIIDGRFLPDSVGVATLSGDISCLSDDNALLSPPEDNALFNMDKFKAFSTMLKVMLPTMLEPEEDVPDDFETSYKYQASTYNLEDGSCYVLAVSSGDKVRILGAKTSYLSGNNIDGYEWKNYDHLNIYEVILSKERIRKIVNDVKNQYTLIGK